VVGRRGRRGRSAARRAPAERSGDSAPARRRPHQAPARTAPGRATTLGRVTSSRVSASGPAGRSSAPARSAAASEAADSADDGVSGYLASQSVAMVTTPRRCRVMDQWCRVLLQVRHIG